MKSLQQTVRKTAALAVAVVFVIFSLGAAQTDNPGDVNETINLPDLPSQASETAQNVLTTIQEFADNLGQALGDALQNILQPTEG